MGFRKDFDEFMACVEPEAQDGRRRRSFEPALTEQRERERESKSKIEEEEGGGN